MAISVTRFKYCSPNADIVAATAAAAAHCY